MQKETKVYWCMLYVMQCTYIYMYMSCFFYRYMYPSRRLCWTQLLWLRVHAEQTWMLCMSPLMYKLLSNADFAEAARCQLCTYVGEWGIPPCWTGTQTPLRPYRYCLIHRGFETNMSHSLGHVQSSAGHTHSRSLPACFEAIFSTVEEDNPEFSVGGSLQGIVLDSSDQQMKELHGKGSYLFHVAPSSTGN